MKRHLPYLVIIAALGFAGVAHAADVGRVLLAAGDNVAVRGNQTVKLTFGTAIQDKDVLRTGPASNLQVRFTDESIVSMKENSELRIEDFQFSGKEDGNERAFFRLVKGGLRAVTGLIGRASNKNYQMSTTTATIGIRGTDYAAMLCQGDCRNNDGSLAKDGLYGRTNGISHGTNRIEVTNERDQKSFGINENFYVADAKSVVEHLLVAPDFLANRLEGRKQGGSKGEAGGSGTEQSTAGGAAAESRPSTTPDALPQLQFVATQNLNPQGTAAVLPPANGFVVVYPLPGSLIGNFVFDDDRLSATGNALNQLLSFGNLGTFPSGSLNGGSIADAGSLTLSNGQVFTWGRWTGNTLLTLSDGSTFTGAPVLFGTATGLTRNNGTSSLGGVATYTFAGGPRPVDAGGNVGSITSTSATINFTQQTTQLSIAMNFPSIVASGVNTGPAAFSVSGPGIRVPVQSFLGDFIGGLSGSCTGSGCASSSASGFYGVGTDGPNGYDFSVFVGQVNGTNAGDVAFLNLYLSSSFTPGPPPASGINGQIAYSNTSPFVAGSTTSLGGSGIQLSGNNLIAYSTGQGFSGTVGTGSIMDPGSTTLVDGSTMNWGRWIGTGVSVTDPASGTLSPGTGVPFILGSSNTVLPTSGTFIYSYAGGPNPVNVNGVAGTFGGGALNITFGSTSGSMSIATPLTMSVGGVNYSLASCTSGCSFNNVSIGLGGPIILNGTCSGGGCSTSAGVTGNVGALFVGPAAGGIAMAGSVATTPSTLTPTVTFGAAFKR